MWLFHPHSAVKIQPFYPVFPLAESIADVFCRLFLWSCKEKSINHFYDTAFLFPPERTPVAQPPHQSKFLRVGVRGRALFIKSALPRTPTRKNFDWWGGCATGVRSGGKRKAVS